MEFLYSGCDKQKYSGHKCRQIYSETLRVPKNDNTIFIKYSIIQNDKHLKK